MIGGISDEGMELRSAEAYDPISRRWSALPVMVTRRAYVGVACLNNCVYAVGGWNEALGALETVEKYCPEEVTPDAHPQPHMQSDPPPICFRRSGWRSRRCRRLAPECRYRR